jgi:hypothetical protein
VQAGHERDEPEGQQAGARDRQVVKAARDADGHQ